MSTSSSGGDKADVVEVKLCEGMIVAVDFTLESREYNDRYYTQVRGYKYTIEGGGYLARQRRSLRSGKEEEPAPAPAKDKVDDLPF